MDSSGLFFHFKQFPSHSSQSHKAEGEHFLFCLGHSF